MRFTILALACLATLGAAQAQTVSLNGSVLTVQELVGVGRMAANLERARAVYAERAKAMCDGLQSALGDAVEFVRPQGGLFVWARLTGSREQLQDSQAFAQRAIEQGVAFVPGAPFYCEQPDRASFRLSFATSDVEKIREGVQRLARAL